MEGGGGLPRPAYSECLISERVWASMSEDDRRQIIGVLDRTKAKETMKLPDVIPYESHFAPAPPGCSFKAKMPGEGYWDIMREQKEERMDEEDARQVSEERARQKRMAMLFQFHHPADAGASADATAAGDMEGKAVAPEMDPSNAGSCCSLSREVDGSIQNSSVASKPSHA